MRNRLRLFVLMGGVGLSLGAAVLVACSDDTSVQPGGTDGGLEGSTTDAPSNPDEGPPDSGTDSPFDGGFQVGNFDSVLATELCKSLARCCYGTPTPADGGADGGTFDTNGCIQNFGMLGFEGSNIGANLKDGGKVILDQVNADSCIKKIQALSCNVSGVEFDAVRTACFGAYSGTVAAGGGCQGSIECQQGNFCNGARNGDGGCAPLRAANAPCGDTANPVDGEEACSYRRGGGSGNFCNFDLPDASDWTCTPARAAGGDCESSVWCNATICGSQFKCETPNRYLDGTCSEFVFP